MNDFENLLLAQKDVFVLDKSIPIRTFISIDLSDKNNEIAPLLTNPSEFENYIDFNLAKSKARVAYGGYLEKRNLYNQSTIFQSFDEVRNIHLGIDLWTKAGTKVLAALDGVVHSIQNNVGIGNYGPTIILEHNIENQKFWTLYGHLSLDSIGHIKKGVVVSKSTEIAKLGISAENGNYAPHLHFQIITEISNSIGDYPGVCSEKKLSFYLNNCPDPNLLLKIN